MLRHTRFNFMLSVFIILILSFSGSAWSNQLQKLSPDLRAMLAEGISNIPSASSKLVTQQADSSIVRVIVQALCSAEKLEQAGMSVISHIGDVFTGTVRLDRLSALSSIPGVGAIKTPSILQPQLTIAIPTVNNDKVRDGVAGGFTGFTGKDSIVAIIDSGIDINHDDFKNPDGSSRILYLWDQTLDGTPPADFTFGLECTKADIDAGTCTHKDVDGTRHTGGGHRGGKRQGNRQWICVQQVHRRGAGSGYYRCQCT